MELVQHDVNQRSQSKGVWQEFKVVLKFASCCISNMPQSIFIEVAKLDEVPAGKMKHIEVNGKVRAIVNLEGKCMR